MIKHLAIILVAICLIGSSVVTLGFAQQEPTQFITLKSGIQVNPQTYYNMTNKVMSNAMTECTMAVLLQLNATNVITCTDSIVNFDKVVCKNPDLSPHIDVCSHGIVKHFVETYTFDSSLGE